MTIPLLPVLDRTDLNFRPQVDTFFGSQLPATIVAMNDEITRINSLGYGAYNSVSTTSLTIGTGIKNLTIETAKSFTVGQPIIVNDPSNPNNYMSGLVTAYDQITGNLSFNSATVSGVGTASNWNVSISATVLVTASSVKQRNITSTDSLTISDQGYVINVSGSFTLSAATAANLGNGWWCYVRNIGTGTVTFDPSGTETINGNLTYDIGALDIILCNGGSFTGISSTGHQVGDVVIGTRKPAGTWLEMTGGNYLQSSYPELFAELGILNNGITPVYLNTATSGPIGGGILYTSATYGNGLYVAVTGSASSNYIATTADGTSWNAAAALPSSRDWTSVTYGNGTFVAIASGGTAAASSVNGTTWTARTLPTTAGWKSVAYGNGKFVAIASSGTAAAVSSDGINWTASTLPVSQSWADITYGNGKFVAIGSSTGTASAVSLDGVNWTTGVLPNLVNLTKIAYGNRLFVAVGSGTVALYSLDGLNWLPSSLPTNTTWGAIAYGGGAFLAASRSASTAGVFSFNGTDWTSVSLPSSNNWVAMAFGNNRFAILGDASGASRSDSVLPYDGTTLFNVPSAVKNTPKGTSAWIKAK